MNIPSPVKPTIRPSSHLALIGFFCLLGLAGAAVVIYSSRWGLWTIEDSIDYFDVANNFAAGRGLVNSRPSGRFPPMHIHPPFYSMVLSAAPYFGLDIMQTARWLNAALFAATISLVGWGLLVLAHSPRLAAVSTLTVLASTAMLNNYTGAMAEGLYFFLGFAALFMVAAHLRKSRSWLPLLAGLAAGLAFLTRFSGAAFVLTGAAGLLVWGKSDLRKRLVETILFCFPGLLPYLLWNLYLRNHFPGVNAGYYEWGATALWQTLQPVRGALLDGAWEWFGLPLLWYDPPYRIEAALLAVFFLAVGLVTMASVRRRASIEGLAWLQHPSLQICALMGGFALISALILIVSYAFVVIPKPALYERILSPIQTGLVLALFAWSEFVASSWRERRIMAVLPLILAAIILMFNIPRSLETARDLHADGLGYNSRAWLSSSLIEQVRRLPEATPIISNQPAPIFYLAGRPSYDMISNLAQAGGNANHERYGDNSRDPNQQIFRADGAALVVFESSIHSQLRIIYDEPERWLFYDLVEGLQLYAHTDEGWIYFYNK